MRVRITVYMALREKLGWGEKVVELPGESATLREVLERVPELNEVVSSSFDDLLILVNGTNVRLLKGLETLLTGDSEVAIFPPGGGGAAGI